MDRKSYKLPFNKTGVTKYQCPSCVKGLLKVKQNTFHFSETKQSSSAHQHEAWEPEWIEYVYSCLIECTNTNCKDTVASTGTGSVTQYMYYDEEGRPDVDYDDFFKPEFFSPHLKIFGIPKGIRSEEHTSELQSRGLISYAVFCLKKKKTKQTKNKKKNKKKKKIQKNKLKKTIKRRIRLQPQPTT